jgi:hypothetical protein
LCGHAGAGVINLALTLDAGPGVIQYYGRYLATLKVLTADPLYPEFPVLVTMTVVAPEYGVALDPASLLQSGQPGATLTYTLVLTNAAISRRFRHLASEQRLDDAHSCPGWPAAARHQPACANHGGYPAGCPGRRL